MRVDPGLAALPLTVTVLFVAWLLVRAYRCQTDIRHEIRRWTLGVLRDAPASVWSSDDEQCSADAPRRYAFRDGLTVTLTRGKDPVRETLTLRWSFKSAQGERASLIERHSGGPLAVPHVVRNFGVLRTSTQIMTACSEIEIWSYTRGVMLVRRGDGSRVTTRHADVQQARRQIAFELGRRSVVPHGGELVEATVDARRLVVADPQRAHARRGGVGFVGLGLALVVYLARGDANVLDGAPMDLVVLLSLPTAMIGLGVLLLTWQHAVDLNARGEAVERWTTIASRRVLEHGRVDACVVVPARGEGYEIEIRADLPIRLGPYPTHAAADAERERVVRFLRDSG